MNKKFKIAVSLIMATMISTSLIACGSKASKSTSTGTSSSANADPLGKYDKPITVTEVLGFNPPEDPKTPKDITPETNKYLKDLKEQLNIEVKYLWTVPKDQYDQKFSLTVASGDMPDIMDLETKDFEKLKSLGQLGDLTEAYNKYASPKLKQYMNSDNGFSLKTTSQDGKIYGIPRFVDVKGGIQLLWVRKDWLNNLNLEAPKTMDDLEKVAEAFVKNDPDKNGKNDTYGVAMQKNLFFWGFDARGFFNSYNSYVDNGEGMSAWLKGKDGKLVAGGIQPETKDALAKLQTWYSKGILDKEFALKDENKVGEEIVAGKVGIVFGEWWYPGWPLNSSKDKDPNADWVAYQLPSVNGKPGKSLVGKSRVANVEVVSKNMKNPEALIKMINFYLKEASPEEIAKNSAEHGYVYNWFYPRVYDPLEIDNTYTIVNKALDAKETVIKNPNIANDQKMLEASLDHFSGDTTRKTKGMNWGLWYSRVNKDGGWGLTKKLYDNKMVTFNEFYASPTPTMVEKGGQLQKLMNETFIKIIMGAPVNEFDKYVESWKKLGGNDITKEVNEWYEKNAIK